MAGEGRNQRFVIGEEGERVALQEITVMEERRINSLELLVKVGIALLRRGELGGEKERGC